MEVDSEFMSRAELVELTDYVQPRAQCEALDRLGIPYKAPNKHPLVSRVHVRQWLAGQPIEAVRSPVMANVR